MTGAKKQRLERSEPWPRRKPVGDVDIETRQLTLSEVPKLIQLKPARTP
jgi:hypothetical protein